MISSNWFSPAMLLRAILGWLMVASAACAQTRLLTFHLTASDAHGDLPENLRREDLRVYDAGVRRPLLFLRQTGGDAWSPAPLGPNERSNRPDGVPPHATVAVLDLFNQDFPAQAIAATRLVRDLQSFPDADSLFLYVLSVEGQTLPVRGIPFDLHFHSPAPNDVPWTAGIKPLMDEAMAKGAGPRRPSLPMPGHANVTFEALDALAVELSRIPGRKNIVWINNAGPLAFDRDTDLRGPAQGYRHELNLLRERFNSTGVALYTTRPFLANGSLLNIESAAGLDQLVVDTGGRCGEGKDTAATIRDALRDARTGYEFGYEAPAEALDGKLHQLRVRANRGGIEIRVQGSYLADPDKVGGDLRRAIARAVRQPFDTAEIGLHGVLVPDARNARLAHLRILVNARDLALANESDGYVGRLGVAVAAYAGSGRPGERPIIPADLVFRHKRADHANVR